jgi:hypothetical protein
MLSGVVCIVKFTQAHQKGLGHRILPEKTMSVTGQTNFFRQLLRGGQGESATAPDFFLLLIAAKLFEHLNQMSSKLQGQDNPIPHIHLR